MTEPASRPARLYTLDALRGLAALCVVFWHWQHFFYTAAGPVDLVVSDQPFYSLLTPLYHYGGLAVQLFFVLSGFVFFWLFSQPIADRSVRPLAFAWDRFSRLYPLHIVSFGLVALLQLGYVEEHGTYFVYLYNDGYHALLNLLLAPAWGFEQGWSFNAPVWSVSVEVLLYASFFLVCQAGRWRWLLAAVAFGLGIWLYPEHYKLGSGVLCFYIGGVTYGLLEWLRRCLGPGGTVVVTTLGCLAAWGWQMVGLEGVNAYLVMCLGFPLTLMMLAAANYRWPTLLRSWAGLGEISYSSYLLHFPLQIVFVMVADELGCSRAVFYQEWVLVLFLAVLLPLSFWCYRWVERPVQRYLRDGVAWGWRARGALRVGDSPET